MKIFKIKYWASTLIELIVAQTIIMIASVLFVVSIVFSLKSFNNDFFLKSVMSADEGTNEIENSYVGSILRKEVAVSEYGNGLVLIETEWYGKGDGKLIYKESQIENDENKN